MGTTQKSALRSCPQATIYNIVGRRGDFVSPPGWLPYYRPVRHRRHMWRVAIPGFVLIGLGLALFIATWAHKRGNRD
jgi:hypothetical protein